MSLQFAHVDRCKVPHFACTPHHPHFTLCFSSITIPNDRAATVEHHVGLRATAFAAIGAYTSFAFRKGFRRAKLPLLLEQMLFA